MNKALLENKVQDFINNRLNDDISKVIFKGSPFTNIDIKELVEQIQAKKKCQKKLSTWFNTVNIYYPNKLNIEQTSSEVTAKYKASLISGKSIIDITGGLGVDCYFFSKKFEHVIHCELNETLSEIASHNFHELQTKNIKTVSSDGLKFITNSNKQYDWIYADPSRRSEIKGKVFLLKDCLPNIPESIDELLKKSNCILLKLSPLIDITSAINELKFVKEIHVVAVKNEVKELLIVIQNEWKKEITIKSINHGNSTHQKFEFSKDKIYETRFSLPMKYLYEPNAAILKSGGFEAISNQLNIPKLHKHSHLYTSEDLIEFPGRTFKIIKSIKYSKKELKKHFQVKNANITTRNFPESVNQIRKKTKIKEGGEYYMFFTTNLSEERIALICKK